ncbi:MAG: tetratricopeptide repeat protein, partial [Planctomycetes bacterium]|nr:tetratricopeptide repeat protein [Planctomycetota bacterium]
DANPQNPHHPPRRVTFGQESTDEMATLTLQLVTADLGARRLLAEANLRRDLDKVGYDAHLLCHLTGLLREMDRNGEALGVIEQVRRREPANAEALAEYGMCLLVAGRLGEAETALVEAVMLDPGQNLARMQLASMLAKGGRTGEAIVLFEEALRLAPYNASLHNNLATACFAENRLAAAEAHYLRCVELDAQHFAAWFNLGRVQAALGNKTAARQALLRAQALRPDEVVVGQELQALDR